jgi:hypothetical protein
MSDERKTFLKEVPLYLVLLVMGLLATMMGQAQTATDACGYNAGNKYPVNNSCVLGSFNKPGSFTSFTTPANCSGTNNNDAWGWFIATGTSTTITFDPDNDHRPIIHLFTGTCGSLTQVACNNSGSLGTNAQVVVNTIPGTNYLIRIQRHASSNSMSGRICIWSPTSTDACSLEPATQVPVGSSCVFRTFNKPAVFNASMNPGGCSSGLFDDAWGSFVATSTTTSITYDPDNDHRPILHVFTGTCAGLAQVSCVNAGSTGTNAGLTVSTVVGQTYYFRVQRHNTSDAMNGRICVWNPPTNDECSNSITLPMLENCFMQAFTNVGGTNSPQTPNPSCGSYSTGSAMDVWFTFTAPPSGQVIIDTEAGSLSAAAMQLYSGTCGSLTAVICNSNGGTGNMPRIDRTCDPLTPGATYRIRFWGTSGGTGTFSLCVYGPENFTPRFEDCAGSIPVCSNQSINNNASTFGCTQDLNSGNRGCLISNERQGSWYTFTPSASGTLEFTITPNGNVDYDFAIWGPMSMFTCLPAGTPIRCSYASPTNNGSNIGAGTYLTGLRVGNTDVSETAYNDQVNGFVAPLDALVGQVFVLYVDNFTSNGQSFNLDWTLTNGFSLNCNVLPVELVAFEAEAASDHVALDWETLTEVASSHFIVERSGDGDHFTPIGSLAAAGHSLERISYRWNDMDPLNGTAYYRLRQVDLDGAIKYSDVVSATLRLGYGSLTLYPNPVSDRITVELPQANGTGTSTIELLDASGRLLRTDQYALEEGQRSISLFAQDLEPGIYLVRAFANNGLDQSIGRFVKH